jgi:Eukaryotic aspartyl protease
MAVTLDTGSSDLWVPSTSSPLCQKGECTDGSFSSSKSSTYELLVPNGFNITYAGPGDSDAGDWGSDTITVGGSPSIKAQTIGVSLDGFDTHGVMGIGYDTNEAYDSQADNGVYPSTVDQMLTQGIIHRKAYSLYLNEYNATTGAVIFGGIDTTKYTGDLVGLPLQLGPQGLQSEFYVTMTSVSFTDSTGAVTQLTGPDYAQSALLDSGTSSTLLNNEVFQQLADGFGAIYVGGGSTAVPCDYATSNATINYQFGGSDGPIVTVPVSQIIGQEEIDATGFSNPSGACDFGIGPPIDGVVILGDTFLRSAYVVYDITNNQAAIAQAKYDVSSSSIVAIPSGTTLPMVTSTATASGTQLSGGAATSEFEPVSATFEGAVGTTVAAGTPTFNLGVTQQTGSASASSTGFAARMPMPTQAAMLGAGLLMGAMVL